MYSNLSSIFLCSGSDTVAKSVLAEPVGDPVAHLLEYYLFLDGVCCMEPRDVDPSG